MNINSPRARRGIYLGLALLLTLVLCVFLGAAVALAPGWLSQARVHSQQDRAEQAALSGAEYLLARLRQNPHYAFNGTEENSGPRVTVDAREMFVQEDQGYIVGLVWDSTSTYPSQFRFRFNYQDGPAKTWLDLPYLCVNNVPGATEQQVPRVSGQSQGKLPPHSVYVAVEGRTGPALSGLSRSRPTAPLVAGSVSRRLLQGVYKVTLASQQSFNSVAASAGDVQVELPPGKGTLQLQSISGEPARIRAKGLIEVQGGGVPAIDSPKQGQLSSSGVTTATRSSRVGQTKETAQAPFLRLPWGDAAGRPVQSMAAGVYVVDDSRKLLYFDMTPSEYVAWMSQPGNAASQRGRLGDDYTLPLAVEFLPGPHTNSVHELRISEEIKIEPTYNSKSFAFMPRRGAPVAPSMETEPDKFSLSSMEADHFLTFSRLSGTTYSDEGYGGTAFGHALNEYLYNHYSRSDPTMNADLIQRTLKVTGRDVDITSRSDGHYEIKNLPLASVKQFLKEVARLSPADSAAPLEVLRGSLAAGGGDSVSGALDRITTENLKLGLLSKGGHQARIECPGKVVVAAQVGSEGGSILAEDEIVLYGFGVDLETQPEAYSSVSLYSKKDLTIKTFHVGDIDPSGRPCRTGYNDVCIRGVLYAWGNINAVLGHPAATRSLRNFRLAGSMVCYGGDPETNPKPVGRASLIYIQARAASLEFDPSYALNLLRGLPSDLKFGQTSWSIR